jgi:phosphoribosylamine--glycine ligase
MGSYSPVSIASPELYDRVRLEIIEPTLRELARQGAPYNGVLYAGLMLGSDGEPRVVEFNCRLGDPEAQVVLPLVTQGLTDCLWQVAQGKPPSALSFAEGYAVTTVLAARGYPDHPEKGAAISIPDSLPDGVTVFHAGTARDPDGTLRVNGGRVLNVTAVARSFTEAQSRSREAAAAISFPGKVFRRDIGWREAVRQKLGV